MKTRKLVLIIADVVLLAVCILQCTFSAHDTTKYFDLKETPDLIVIDAPEEKGITVVCENGSWYVGKDKFPANMKLVNEFLDAVMSVRVIDKVGSTGNEATLERYELNDLKKTVVTVSKDGKVLRTLNIGKEAVSDSQGYITVDGGKDIYLATGSLHYIFDINTNAIRSETVLALNSTEISEVSISNADGDSWSLSRMGAGDDVVWNISGAEVDIDSAKAANWFGTIANMSTRNWYEEKDVPEGDKIITAKIVHNFKTTTLDFYAIPKEEGVPQAYYGRCSDMTYAFSVGSEYVEPFKKVPEELAK